MVPRENKNNAYAKLGGGKQKEYYGIFQSGLYCYLVHKSMGLFTGIWKM